MTKALARGEGAPSDETAVTWQRVSSVAQLSVGSLVREVRPAVVNEQPVEFDGFNGRVYALGQTLVSRRDAAGRPDGDSIVDRPGSLVIEFTHEGQPAGLGAFVEPQLGLGDYGTTFNGSRVVGSGRYLEVAVDVAHPGLSQAA